MRVLALLILWLPLMAVARELPINTRLGGDFQLQSTQPAETRLSDFKGRVVLLNFGYTSCPDVCPTVLNRIAKVMNALEDDRTKVQPLFVSFDPARDTVERLKAYLNYFGKDFIGMTGTPEQIAAVAKQYGVVYIAQQSGSAAGVEYAHSDYIYLLDQQGRVRALFSSTEPVAHMTDAVESLLDN